MKIIKGSFLLSLLSVLCLQSIASPFQANTDTRGPSINLTALNKPAETVSAPVEDSASVRVKNIDTRYKAALSKLKVQAASVAEYAKANNYSTEYVFLLDMSLPSGKNRFFVYNLKKDEVVASSLVTHGVGSNRYETDDPLEFSNEPYSMKTSIGKYKIGASYFGKFGLAYKLHGLDKTNDKAFERTIVLHSHKQVPDTETYPGYIIVSAGCPTVSPAFLGTLDKYIKGSKKPILMWIYN
jgi:hypothetical protein